MLHIKISTSLITRIRYSRNSSIRKRDRNKKLLITFTFFLITRKNLQLNRIRNLLLVHSRVNLKPKWKTIQILVDLTCLTTITIWLSLMVIKTILMNFKRAILLLISLSKTLIQRSRQHIGVEDLKIKEVTPAQLM